MGLRLIGLRTALPLHSIPQELAAQWTAQLSAASAVEATYQRDVFRKTGIRQRGSVLLELDRNGELSQSFYEVSKTGPTTARRMQRYSLDAPPLALQAAAPALQESRLTPSDITHVITVSCTGCIAPGLDHAISQSLGLSRNVSCTHVGFMGCAGVFNALNSAKPIVESNPSARILLCAVELCTLHLRFDMKIQQIIANSLFADGAAALVAEPAMNGGAIGDTWNLESLGSCTIAKSTEALGWRIGDHGFEMRLSPELPSIISAGLRSWLEPWLRKQGLQIADIPTWAIHPGGPRILEAVAESLQLTSDSIHTSAEVLMDHGNMSSPTILFILQKLRLMNAPRPCIALGFGPGVVAHAALFR